MTGVFIKRIQIQRHRQRRSPCEETEVVLMLSLTKECQGLKVTTRR